MPEKPTFEELRTSARCAQILDAATRVFAEKGYHRATTKDIARAAELAEGTIYLYFKNKDDLLIALLESLDQATTQSPDLEAGLDLSMGELLTQRLEIDLARLGPKFNLILATLPEVLADPALRPQYYQRLVQPGLEGLSAHLKMRQERGEAQVDNIPMAARIFISVMFGMEILHILGDETVREAWQNPRTMAAAMAQVLLEGMQHRR